MSRLAQSCPSVCPLSARRRSSNSRRLASASALHTLSMSASTAPLCNLSVACQGRFYTPLGIHAAPAVWRGDAQASTIYSSGQEANRGSAEQDAAADGGRDFGLKI